MEATSGTVERLEALVEERRFEEALGAVEARLARASDDDGGRLSVLRVGVRAAHFLRDRERAHRFGHEALGIAQRSGDLRARARAHNDLAVLFGADMVYERALEHLYNAVHLQEEAGLDVEPAILNNLANVHLHLNQSDEAKALLARAIEGYRERGEEAMAAHTLSNLGRAYLVAGQPGAAIPHLADALERQGRLREVDGEVATLERLGSAHGRAGAPERARQAFERAVQLLDEGHGAIAELDVRRAFGMWAVEVGDVATALAQLETARTLAEGDRLARAGVLEPLSRALEAGGRLDEALATLREHVAVVDAAERDKAAMSAQLRLLDLELGIGGEQAISRLRTAELERLNRQLRVQAEAMEHLSVTDALTGLPNRRAVDRRVSEELARWERHGRPFVLALLDLDTFKDVNDRHGHDVGDEVLRRVAQILQGSLRAVDVVARWGGEEFALVLPDTDLDGAVPVLQRVLDSVKAERWDDLLPDRGMTASVGAATPSGSADARELLQAADARLFAAKRAGRDRIVVRGGLDADRW